MQLLKAILFILVVSISTSSYSQEEKSKKEKRKEQKNAQFEEARQIIESSHFVFNAAKAFPQSGKMIDLTTNPGDLRVTSDSVIAHLPFFGRSYSGGYSNTDGGMRFSGIKEDVKLEINDKKPSLTLSFKVKNSTGTYQCFLEVTSLNTASLSINSSSRSSISYNGSIQELSEE